MMSFVPFGAFANIVSPFADITDITPRRGILYCPRKKGGIVHVYRFAKEYTLPGENVNDFSEITARNSAAKAGVRGECCKFATLSGNQGKMEPFEKNSSEKRLDFSSSSAIIGSEGDLYRLNNYFK